MGKLLKAECCCGYETSVMVGSGREGHGKVFEFPHHCTECNEAVTADLLQPQVTCPLCNGNSLKIFGTQERDNAKKKPWFLKVFEGGEKEQPRIIASAYCYNIETTFEINDRDHFCPKCKRQTLQFSLEALLD